MRKSVEHDAFRLHDEGVAGSGCNGGGGDGEQAEVDDCDVDDEDENGGNEVDDDVRLVSSGWLFPMTSWPFVSLDCPWLTGLEAAEVGAAATMATTGATTPISHSFIEPEDWVVANELCCCDAVADAVDAWLASWLDLLVLHCELGGWWLSWSLQVLNWLVSLAGTQVSAAAVAVAPLEHSPTDPDAWPPRRWEDGKWGCCCCCCKLTTPSLWLLQDALPPSSLSSSWWPEMLCCCLSMESGGELARPSLVPFGSCRRCCWLSLTLETIDCCCCTNLPSRGLILALVPAAVADDDVRLVVIVVVASEWLRWLWCWGWWLWWLETLELLFNCLMWIWLDSSLSFRFRASMRMRIKARLSMVSRMQGMSLSSTLKAQKLIFSSKGSCWPSIWMMSTWGIGMGKKKSQIKDHFPV